MKRVAYGVIFLAVLIPLIGFTYKRFGFVYRGIEKGIQGRIVEKRKAVVKEFTETNGERVIRIPLLGPDTLSEPVQVPPAGWRFEFGGPSDAEVCFSDGECGPITKWFDVKIGSMQFKGPAGKEVLIRMTPPELKLKK